MSAVLAPSLQDRYPSRNAAEAALLRREDPVVHGTADDGPLDAEQLTELTEQGFLQLDDVFTPDEVGGMLAELRHLAADPAIRGDDRSMVVGDDIRRIFEVHSFSALIDRVVRDPRLVGVARQTLGSDVYLHQTRLSHKPGFDGRERDWHSDFETWHCEDGMPSPRALTALVALTDNDEQNGPLLLMPGSHQTYVSCIGETPDGLYEQMLVEQEVGHPDQTSLSVLADRCGVTSWSGRAGSVLFLDPNCMLGSNGNITPFPRVDLCAVYNSVDNALQDPYGADRPRPSFIANRDPSPIGSGA